MNKGAILFWSLFVGILVFAFGVQFAYSQVGGFATTQPSSGVSHTSNEIVCNDCITSNNLGYDSVMNGEISPTALISVRKTNGVNGWHFTTGIMANQNTWYPAISTDLTAGGGAGVMGATNWFGSNFEIVCDSNEPVSQGDIIFSNGLGLSNIFRDNHKIIRLHPTYNEKMIYFSRINPNSLILSPYQILKIRATAQGDFLEFSRQYVPGTGWSGANGIEPEITNFECVIRLSSLCNSNNPCVNFAY